MSKSIISITSPKMIGRESSITPRSLALKEVNTSSTVVLRTLKILLPRKGINTLIYLTLIKRKTHSREAAGAGFHEATEGRNKMFFVWRILHLH